MKHQPPLSSIALLAGSPRGPSHAQQLGKQCLRLLHLQCQHGDPLCPLQEQEELSIKLGALLAQGQKLLQSLRKALLSQPAPFPSLPALHPPSGCQHTSSHQQHGTFHVPHGTYRPSEPSLRADSRAGNMQQSQCAPGRAGEPPLGTPNPGSDHTKQDSALAGNKEGHSPYSGVSAQSPSSFADPAKSPQPLFPAPVELLSQCASHRTQSAPPASDPCWDLRSLVPRGIEGVSRTKLFFCP